MAFLLALGTIGLFWLWPSRFLLIIEPLFRYLIFLLPDVDSVRSGSPLAHFMSLLLILAYVFVFWLVIVWCSRRSSRDFKLALGLCAVAGLGVFWGLKAYRERIDWTSRGLNPDRPGFRPSVVLLAGTFKYTFTGMDTGRRYTGTARFEIRMKGAEYYYAERWRWKASRPKYGSWDKLILALPGFFGTWTRSYSGSGYHGRGGSSEANHDGLLVARRLWRGETFVGATAADEYSLQGATERFSQLKPWGQFKIPERIEFTDGDRREVLHVRRVEFLTQPSTNWFWLVKRKYFNRSNASQQLLRSNLNEAGWAGEPMP